MRIRHISSLLVTALLLARLASAAPPFTPKELDVFLDDAVDGPKLELRMRDGSTRLLFADADASWDNEKNQGIGRLLSLKQGEKKAALIRFDLDGVRDGLLSAMLRITVMRAPSVLQSIRVSSVSADEDDWNEASVTRSSQPGLGELISVLDDVQDDATYDVDVTAHILQAIKDDRRVSFKLTTDQNGDNLYLASREDAFMKFGHFVGQRMTSHEPYNMVNSKTFFLMALTTFHAPDATSAKGVLVKKRLLEALRAILKDGCEPDAGGRLEWSHCPVAMGLALIRHTDAVWDKELTQFERAKIATLMKAMAIAGDYCFEDDNDFIGNVALDGPQRKDWNPNHVEPYVGVIIAGSLFFGGEELDSMFASFGYDEAVAEFKKYGLSNIETAWSQTTARNMESTGVPKTIPDRGTGLGVNAPFSYSGIPNEEIPRYYLKTAGIDDSFGIYNNLAQKMYAWKVADVVRRGDRVIGRIENEDAPPSPYLGRIGMLYEYNAGDASGPRSCSAYAFDGWQNNIMSAATLIAFGRWGEGVEPEQLADLEQRMIVGSEDFRQKLTNGWLGRKNGTTSRVQGVGRQHELMFLLWDEYVKPTLR